MAVSLPRYACTMVQTEQLNPAAPGAAARSDAEKAVALRRMKNIALGLLVFMAVVFCVAFAFQEQYPWLNYVRAAAEGGMVGALADWFAVTALFRHPMGIKIPHTAIIPNRKDEIGNSLAEFVETNFLSERVVGEKLASMRIAQKLGGWLAKPESAERVAAEGAAAIRGAMTVLKDDDVQDVIESMVRKHVVDPPWGPPVGKLAERIFADGHHHALVDLLVDRSTTWIRANHATISGLVVDRSPSWVPQFLDGMVGDKIYNELYKFARAVQSNPDHEVRQQLDNYLKELAQELQHDPAMIAKAESIKSQVLGDPEVRELAGRTWETLKGALTDAVEDPNSELRVKFVGAVQAFGGRLVSDEELAAKANKWISDAAAYLVGTYKHEITSLISDTVRNWDAQETSEKIELQVGKDLQFIRINGTVVGSLAGVAIFTVASLVFG